MTRVAFPGAPGAFNEDAARLAFGDQAVTVPTDGFAATLEAVRIGGAEACVMPVANTIAGPVTDALAAIAAAPWTVASGEVTVAVRQCLLGVAFASVETIVRVASHPVALRQCRRFLAMHPRMQPEPYGDTGSAARAVAHTGDPGWAAIGSRRAAILYGLVVVATDIQDAQANDTRFMVLMRR